jgi:hypothetical protein
MRILIISYCLFVFGCSNKWHAERTAVSSAQIEKIRLDGIYYGASRNYDPAKKQYSTQYPYLKFYGNGMTLTGIALDSTSFNQLFSDNLKAIDSNKAGGRFTVVENAIYVEQSYSGMKTGKVYEVYNIQDRNSLLWVGSARKIGKLETSIPEPIVFRFLSW